MKTPLLKSNLLIKPSIVLAVAVFIAAFLPVPFARAGTDPLMPTGPGDGLRDNGVQPFDPDPAASGSLTKEILTYGTDADGNPVPRKTLRITNNATDVTVYPFLESPNTGTITGDKTVAKYDPYDPANKEYRGYIGYKNEKNGKYYFGLKPGKSIVVSLPLVFWNGGRIFVGTDSKYLTPAANPNPQRYNPIARRAIAPADPKEPIANGVIMWYRSNKDPEHPEKPAKAVGVADDSEDQLAEWTIRDHVYLSSRAITTKSHGEIPDNQLLNLINYDVSNVDTLYLPLAMEVNDTWVIPQTTHKDKASDRSKPNLTGGWSAGSHPEAFGWTGAIDAIKVLQSKIRDFTADNNQLLGKYFGGKGWPFYNFPGAVTDPSVPIKIPSGANIFPQSPFSGKNGSGSRSSYDNQKYLLSSGGTGRIAEFIGAECDQSGLKNNQVRLSPGEPQSKIDFVQVGYIATASPNRAGKEPIPPGTTVTVTAVDNRIVTLSRPLVAPAKCSVVTFTRPKRDYAAEAMIRLWYSWAQYYLMHWKKTEGAPTAATIRGSNKAVSATLTFNEKHPELVKGMAVTGPGLKDAQTEVDAHQGDAVILDIASDQKSVLLSQVMIPSSTNQLFTFSPPKALLWTPTPTEQPVGYPLFGDQFKFSNEPKWHDPYEFSQQVYLIMASMNQIGKHNNDNVFKFMQDIIGANMGFIFTQQAKNSDDGKAVTSKIRDMIKSVLRGVIDFTKFPDNVNDKGNHVSWYPDPKEHRGGQDFNVFNLDPFVWFVHVKLGFSGYGFSVDDDTADIGSDGQEQLQLSIAGTGGLKNPKEWSIQAPYGPVKNIFVGYSGPAHDNRTKSNPDPKTSRSVGETPFLNITNVSDTEPIRVTAPHHLANGDKVFIDQVKGENAANGWFKVGNVTTNTFDLFDAATGTMPIAPSGAYTGGGRWSYPLHPYIVTGDDPTKVFYRVKGDDPSGLFQGTFVSVNIGGKDLDENPITKKKFRVWRLGLFDEGHLLLDADLTNDSGTPLVASDYTFTFYGVAGK